MSSSLAGLPHGPPRPGSQTSASLAGLPHAPQLLRSLSVSPQRLATHWLPSRCSFWPQRTRCPWSQISSSLLLTPQPPQFRSSESVSVHAPAHDVCPLRQALTHTPLLQTWPLLHAFPQTPQFALSLLKRAQASPQAVSPSPAVRG